MANDRPNPTGFAGGPSVLESLTANQSLLQGLLFVLNVGLLCIPLGLLIGYHGWATSPQYAVVMTFALAFAVFISTLIFVAPSSKTTLFGTDRLRVLLLVVTALIGADATLVGLGLPILSDALRPVFTAGVSGWRERPRDVLLCSGLFVGGLIVMFLGVQLARGFERTRADLRRVLYGYNAFLSSLLLFSALFLLNLLAYSDVQPFKWFEKTTDWTSNRLYTLNDNTVKFLKNMKEPVKVYVFLQDPTARRDVLTLLDNIHSISDQVSYQYVSRDRDSSEYFQLLSKYNFSSDLEGLLVVYGQPGSEVWETVRFTDLFSRSGQGGYQFTGEGALVKAVDYLSSGKSKTNVYFTQGHGEYPAEGEESVSRLRSRLGEGNYELHDLTFTPDMKSIPADASLVAILRPRQAFSRSELNLLRTFLRGDDKKKKGKLLILFDITTIEDKWFATGLEELVKEFNVQVNDDRVLQARQEPNPASLLCCTNPRNPTPIGPAFWGLSGEQTIERVLFNMRRARSVEPIPSQEGLGSSFNVQPLIFPIPEKDVWVEKNLKANVQQIASEIVRDPVKRQQFLSKKAVSVAVTVTESRVPAQMRNPHNPQANSGEEEPRLVVFGDASWVTNRELDGKYGEADFSLFKACVAWLRERPDLTTSDRAQRDWYHLNALTINPLKLYFQPLGLMILCVIGLGGAVWITRRR